MNNAQHTADSAKHTMTEAVDVARDGVEVAKRSTLQTLASGGAMLAKGVSAASLLVAALRKFDRDDGLAWFGLARQRSPLATVATFGAGAAFGAGLGLLLAPTSGAALRRMLLERLTPTKAEDTASSDVQEAAVGTDGSHLVASATRGSGSDGAPRHVSPVPVSGERAKSS